MPGGARAHSGPAPDPNALRRDRDGESWVTLPAEGRSGAAPKWPLAGKSKREAELWAQEWKRPQAVIWEANGQEIEVALYVRSLIAAESSSRRHLAFRFPGCSAITGRLRTQGRTRHNSAPQPARHRRVIASGS